jgi:hypothetical protein
MSKKKIGIALCVLGVVLAVVSLGADTIGLGTDAGIHWAQLTAAGIGILAAVIGTWLALKSPGMAD